LFANVWFVGIGVKDEICEMPRRGHRLCAARDARCEMRDVGFGMRDSGCGLRGPGFGMRDSGCGLRGPGFGMREVRCD
jgi:hypothetical protein